MNIHELHVYAKFVAEAMSNGWEYLDSKNYFPATEESARELKSVAYITRNDGGQIYLSNDSYRKKLNFQVTFPREYKGENTHSWMPYKFECAEMSVSYGREPAKVAKEVTRKLEANALEAYAHFLERARIFDETSDKQSKALEELRASGVFKPSELREPAEWNRSDKHVTIYFDGGHGRVEHGYIKLEIGHLNAKQAIAVMRALQSAE